MKNAFTILSLIIFLTSCGLSKSTNSSKNFNASLFSVDTSKIAIIPYKANEVWEFGDCIPTDLNQKDLEIIEKQLRLCIDNYNPKQEKRFKKLQSKKPNYSFEKKYFTIDVKKYKRQYVAITNNKGEKEVWVNCFCGNDSDSY